MATIITRVGKGSPLTNAEVDANFTNLNSELATKADSSLLASYQPLDSDLSAIAGLSGSTGILRKTAANAWSLDTNTYLTSFTETDPIFSASPAAGISNTNISNWNTAYNWGNHASAGYLTSFTETDPTVGSHIKAITTTNISNWNTAFGWGNHASAGYLTGITSGQVTTALGYTPANRAGDTFTGTVTINTAPLILSFSGSLPYIDLQQSGVSGGINWRIRSGIEGVANGGLSIRDTTAGANRLTIDSAGAVTANVDLRAPIFYDSANTSYYVDPTGSTSINVAGNILAAGNVELANGSNRRIRLGSATNYNYDLTTNGDNFQIVEAGTTPRLTISYPSGAITASTDFRAPVFYDSANTGFYADPAGTSNFNSINVAGGDVYRSSWIAGFQSTSDFVNGTLVATDIPANIESGDSFLIEITGKSYSATNPPFKVLAQGYLYANLIISTSGISYGGDFASYIKVFEDGGVLKFWWPTVSYWNSFEVRVLAMNGPTNGNITRNRVTGITNSTEPTGTKKVQVNLARNMRGDVSATNSVDLRAPIFYDSNNTAFYVSPDDNSLLSAVRARGQIRATGWWDSYSGSTSGLGIEIGQSGNRGFILSYNRDSSVYGPMSFEATDFSFNGMNGAYAQINTSFRAPIFYDSANTGYYIDPASTSNLVGLTVANTITGSISGNAATVSSITNLTNLGRNSFSAGVVDGLTTTNFRTTMFGNTAATWNIATSRWNSVPTAFSGLGMYGTAIAWSGSDTHAFLALNYSSAGAKIGGGSSDNIHWSADLLHSSNYTSYAMPSGSSATNSVDVRAPIFYDSNDTAYYIDAAGNNVLNTLYFRTGSVQAKFAQASYFGYSSSYRTVVLGNESLTTISMGVDVISNASGSFNGGGEGREIIFRNGVNFITPNSANNSYLNPFSMADGYAYSTGSFRAPIFYDSNNTGYYIDGASTSSLNVLLVGGGLGVYDTGLTSDPYGKLSVTRSSGANYTYLGFTRSGQTAIGMGIDTSNAFWIGSSSAGYDGVRTGTALSISAGGAVTATTDIRAPIFYDSSNSGYYLDPASTSLTYRMGAYYLQNNTDVSTDHPFGLYFSNGLSTAYAIYRESGAWTHPYPDLRIAFHTGIKMGANASYGGMKFYTDYDMATQVMSINNAADGLGGGYVYVNDALQAGGSLRAPIFYDSNDTSRYLDPASTSVISNLIMANSGPVLTLRDTDSTGANQLGYISFQDSGNAERAWFGYGSTANTILYMRNSVGPNYMFADYTEASGSVRSPIFYDSDNTAYYVNPAGTSYVSGDFQVQQSSINGIRLLSANGTQSLWIRAGYDTDGSATPALSATNIQFQSSGSSGGSFTFVSGNTKALTITGDYAQGGANLRAPIFYDSNNTGFYIDAASTSNINQLNANGKIVLETSDNFLRINQYNGFSSGIWMGPSNIGGSGELHLGSNGTPSTARVRVIGGTYNGSVAITLNGADGSITAAGNVTAFSDIRVKDNVETVPAALAKLNAIRGVTYTRTDLDDKERRYAGVIAQEIEQVLPEAVREINDIKTVDYNATIALLIQAVKELNAKVWNLEAELATK